MTQSDQWVAPMLHLQTVFSSTLNSAFSQVLVLSIEAAVVNYVWESYNKINKK